MESEVKQWLQSALEAEKLKDFSVKIVGNTEKGEGYVGDIVFVDVFGITEDDLKKEYNLVLKCSKKSDKLREQIPIKQIFLNEITVYEEIIPAFVRFENEKGIEDCFDSVAKYYGKFVSDSMEVIAFQNLKKMGYDLWDKKKPLARKYIDLVMGKYAQFHAISVAMNDQKPEKFQSLSEKLQDLYNTENNKEKTEDPYKMWETCVQEVYDVLLYDLEEDMLLKWQNLKSKIRPFFQEIDKWTRVKVITHGDCWNNNFMYLCENGKKQFPKEVAMLDWQISKFVTAITDLSYFLFACISKDDLMDLDSILERYYEIFANHLEKLGSNASVLYPYEEFLNDWKKCCKFGIIFTCLIHKIVVTEKDEVVDIAECADQGKSFASTFLYESKNKEAFKNRIRPIVKYAVEHDLI